MHGDLLYFFGPELIQVPSRAMNFDDVLPLTETTTSTMMSGGIK